MKPSHVALVLLAIVALYWRGRADGASDVQDAEVTAHSEDVLHANRVWVARAAQLRSIEVAHERRFAALQRRADSLDQLLLTNGSDTTPPADTANWSRLLRWRAVAFAKDSAVRECSVVMTACEQRAANAEDRVRQLHAALLAQVQVGQCHYNLLVAHVPCVSRTVAFFLGTAVGGAAMWAAKQ